jgi:hypothetical protein
MEDALPSPSHLTGGSQMDVSGEVVVEPRQDAGHGAKREPLHELQEQLAREFVGVVPREAIDEAAKGALEEFVGARIRAFVPVLAWRRARGLLRGAPIDQPSRSS